MSDNPITIEYQGNTVETTIEEIKNMAEENEIQELSGMPEYEPLVIKKATGVLEKSRGEALPEVGDTVRLRKTYEVTAITEQHDKKGRTEYVVTYKVLQHDG